MWDFPLFPEQASTIAAQVDQLYYVLIGLSLLFAVPVAGLIAYFAIRYRSTADVDRKGDVPGGYRLEVAWIVGPLILGLAVFGWGGRVYVDMFNIPENTLDVYVVGRQWMWKAQHPTGQREINTLHVPVNRPVKLTMISEDVIHSFYVPDFRIKRDVLPGRYTTIWFEATSPGEYNLFCAEYCGTEHSRMIGSVVAMEPWRYQNWLQEQPIDGSTILDDSAVLDGEMSSSSQDNDNADGEDSSTPTEQNLSMAQAGEDLFGELGCTSCHNGVDDSPGPPLAGVFESHRQLESGRRILADEQYLRRSVFEPNEEIVAGYRPIMPTYKDQIDEEQMLFILEYVKSLDNEHAVSLPPGQVPSGRGKADEEYLTDVVGSSTFVERRTYLQTETEE